MPFRLTKAVVKLRDAPRDDAANPAGIVLMNDLLEKLADAPVTGWWRVQVVTPGAAPREGFIRSDLLKEVEAPVPGPEIDQEKFFQQLTFAAQAHGSNRSYLYALAFLESGGVRNVASETSSAFGPFQFMPRTWNDLVVRHGEATGVTAADRTDPGAQAIFAAIATAEAQKQLAEQLGRVPSAVELYLAHFLGRDAASAVLKGSPDQPIDRSLRVFYRGTQLGESHVDKILAANRSLLSQNGQVRAVRSVLDEVATRLGPGVAAAAALAERLGPPPDDLPGDPGEQPPWLTPARAELASGVVEDKSPGASNPEIEKYFGETGFGPARDDTAWCAAFVSWCMANSGNARVVAGNRRSARAAHWLDWGFSLGRPAHGAVAVTFPQVEGSSGHVGFVTAVATDRIRLLGGNQRNPAGDEAVCEADFGAADIREYRWLDWK